MQHIFKAVHSHVMSSQIEMSYEAVTEVSF